MNICFHCGKGVLMGRTHTHHRGVAGGRWKKRAPKVQRVFYPNLQPMNIFVSGKIKRVKLCTSCLKRVKKDVSDGVRPFVELAQLQPKKISATVPSGQTNENKKNVSAKEKKVTEEKKSSK